MTDEERRERQRQATERWALRRDPDLAARRQAKAERLAAGLCKNGHGPEERKADGVCKACQREKHARWREKNLEYNRARARAWIAKHHERHLENVRKWREANKERKRETFRQYQIKHAAQFRVYAQQRLAVKRGAVPTWFGEIDLFVLEEAADIAARRAALTGFPWAIDHRVPLKSKRVCGLHCAANLDVIPASENSRKHNRYWPDM